MNIRPINISVVAALVGATLFACSTDAPDDQHWQTAKLDDVEFAVPRDWQPTVQSEAGRASVTWGAKRTAHASKSTVTVVRARPPGITRATSNDQLITLLQQAQAGLPNANFGVPSIVQAAPGLVGLQIVGEFTAPNAADDHNTQRYQRIHTILRADTGLVHVLYTAPVGTPIEEQAAYTQALAHIHITKGA
jgi:hypothetical protein